MKNIDFSTLVEGMRVAVFTASLDKAAINALSQRAADVLLQAKQGPISPERKDGIVYAKYDSYRDVARNNANCLILGGMSAIAGKRFKSIGHAELLCVPLGLGVLSFLPGMLRYWAKGRLSLLGTTQIPGSGKWLVFKNTNPKYVRGPRFWIDVTGPGGLNLSQFDHLDYCVLRWAHQLKTWEQLSDLDVLVSDSDIAEFVRILDERIGCFPIDVFSESGLSGHEFRGVSYYSPHIAKRLLAALGTGFLGSKVADKQNAYLAYCYHLIFHKGPRNQPGDNSCNELTWVHPKYFKELERLAAEAGFPGTNQLSSLIEQLEQQDWLPPRDTISVHAKHNAWIQNYFFSAGTNYRPGLSVFMVREYGAQDDRLSKICQFISDAGYGDLQQIELSPEMQRSASHDIRGGNWTSLGTGPEMGEPRIAIVAQDPDPRPLKGRRLKKKYPRLDNKRVLVKHDIREYFMQLESVPTCNLIHASDNTDEAIDYLKIVGCSQLPALREKYKIEVAD